MALPEVTDFYIQIPLYKKYKLENEDLEWLYQTIYFQGKLDTYCPACTKISTFKSLQKYPSYGGLAATTFDDYDRRIGSLKNFQNRTHTVKFNCTRNESHIMEFVLFLDNDMLFKIGQYPSLAELSIPEIKKYRAILTEEKYKEFNRGIGLVTHSIGVGAFVYLRRLFEDLIGQAYIIASQNPEWNDSIFLTARMDEKINLLKHELPEFLVENRKLYSILSKGIHELSEDECLEYFPTIKLGIELILDEKLEKKKRADKIELAKESINKIHQEIK